MGCRMPNRRFTWLAPWVCFAILAGLPRGAMATALPVSGPVPERLAEAFRSGLFASPSGPQGLRAIGVQTRWVIPVVLVSFQDDSVRYTPHDFNVLLFDTTGAVPTGSAYDYWRWVSRGRVQLTGRVVAQVRLPETRSYYAGNNSGLSASATPRNSYGAVHDALAACEGTVNWPEFDLDQDGYVDMLWIVHAGLGGEAADASHLWSITSRMSVAWARGGPFVTTIPVPGSGGGQMMRLDRFTILPELSPFHAGAQCEIGVFCHEFGHALGLPDLYDTTNPYSVGPGNWSLMSSGEYGGDGMSPESPTHLGAWPIQFLGWDNTLRPERDTTLSIAPLADSSTIINLWYQGEDNPEHFLIENRRRIGFDRSLVQEGLLIYHVDENAIDRRLPSNMVNVGSPALLLVEADGNHDLLDGQNRADAGDPFPGALGKTVFDDRTIPSTVSWSGLETHLAVQDIGSEGDHMRFTARVRSMGWLPPEDHTGAGFSPYPPSGSARTSAVDPNEVGYVVQSEFVNGRPQIMLRTSADWDHPFQVSNSTGAAVDPALALMPGGDLAIVWSDTRDSHTRIFYRSFVRGVWTDERLLVSLPGTCRSPAIAADGGGGISLAFQHLQGDSSRIMFMRFTYYSPVGQPVRVTGPPQKPESPLVVASPTGKTYILWQDRTPPQTLWFARYLPDSGLRPSLTLAAGTPLPQSDFSAVVDTAGALHVVYLVTGSGLSTLHYLCRRDSTGPNPPDELVESSGNGLQNPMLEVDRYGALHLTFESVQTAGVGLRYRHRSTDRGWDAVSTDLSYPDAAGGSRPVPLPTFFGNVSVVYVGTTSPLPSFMVKRRVLSPDPTLDAPVRRAAVTPTLVIGPNPLRAGRPLRVWSGSAPIGPAPVADVFDLAGRIVTTIALGPAGGGWSGRLEGETSARWASGIYFARVRTDRGPPVRLIVLR